MDGDGEIDCSDTDSADGASSMNYMLDFHVRFDMKEGGSSVTVSDLIDSFLDPSATTAQYSSTGIYISYLKTFSSETSGTVTFSDSAVTTQICHVGLSYDDKLGMRYFENIQNAAGTCEGDV